MSSISSTPGRVRSGFTDKRPAADISQEADTLPGEDGMRKGTEHHRVGRMGSGNRRSARGTGRDQSRDQTIAKLKEPGCFLEVERSTGALESDGERRTANGATKSQHGYPR
jgi:hypothetical protein